MRASSPLVRGQRKMPSLFEWKNGEITGITDEQRLSRAEKLRHKPTQMSFFFGQEEHEALAEDISYTTQDTFVETIASSEEWQPDGESTVAQEEWEGVQAS
jgi:hypothetical protein